MTRAKVTYYFNHETKASESGWFTEEKFFAKRENAEAWVVANTERFTYTNIWINKTYAPKFELTDLTLEDE